jgi:hypothetical protein
VKRWLQHVSRETINALVVAVLLGAAIWLVSAAITTMTIDIGAGMASIREQVGCDGKTLAGITFTRADCP